ncbi:RasGEF domain-containing protein [Planoprotostelium fungivorum]|uniref:RasGEF domain-containing protein n=1 Tax=Planoprotostelium fungivorum TaxID=1890364 RepID=A0A2P6NTN7_9EUKA|nr:RasGEF domain-containing protein [Planoprotostelium fungivorum]
MRAKASEVTRSVERPTFGILETMRPQTRVFQVRQQLTSLWKMSLADYAEAGPLQAAYGMGDEEYPPGSGDMTSSSSDEEDGEDQLFSQAHPVAARYSNWNPNTNMDTQRGDLADYNPTLMNSLGFSRRASAIDKRRATSFDIVMDGMQQKQKLDQQGKPVDIEAAVDKDFNDKSDEAGLQNLQIDSRSLTIIHRHSERNYNVCVATLNMTTVQVEEFPYLTREQERRFVREARLLRNLNHVNLLLFIGYCVTPHSLVYEHLDQGSLSALITDPRIRLTHANILNLFCEIAKGLSYLHSQNPPIFHRHVTSDMIVVGENWRRVKIKGVGITAYRNSQTVRAWEANVAYSELSDVYGLGAIVLECLTRRRAHEYGQEIEFDLPAGQLSQVFGTRQKKWNFPIPPLCPPFLQQLMETCWHDNPKMRPTCQEMISFIQRMQKWFNRGPNDDDLRSILDRDIQTIYYPTPMIGTEPFHGYARYVSSLSYEEESLMTVFEPWAIRDNNPIGLGAITMHSDLGQCIYLHAFPSLDHIRAESIGLMSQQNEGFFSRLNQLSATSWSWKVCEFSAWSVTPDTSYCVLFQMNIQENSEFVVKAIVQQWHLMLMAYPYSRGVVFVYDPTTFTVTIFCLLKDEESQQRLNMDGATNHLYLMLYQAGDSRMTSNWSVEGYHLGFSYMNNVLLKQRTT